ncbi:hypothetical protein V501_01251 [Pseudogymnoascus sp. VKM F-4519 (FW-2642)]|nr:hypothetical protein V501_01251 [Pseudogymnoascus sp. VKM F-4519 (FW-2642)]
MRIITVSGASPTRAQAHPRGYEGYDPTLESGPENQVYACFVILWVESRVWKIQKANISSPWGLIQETRNCGLTSSPVGLGTRSAKLRSDLEPHGIDITQAPLNWKNETSSVPPYGDAL